MHVPSNRANERLPVRQPCQDPPIPFAGLRRAPRGALLVLAGAPASHAYMLRRGQVRVFLITERGRETTTAVLGPGQVVGVSGLLGRPHHHAFVQTLTPVEAWALPVDRLFEHMARDRALSAAVAIALTRRLILTEALVADVALRTVRERIPLVLERLTACLGGEAPQLTRETMSQLIGARRETVSRAFGPTDRAAA